MLAAVAFAALAGGASVPFQAQYTPDVAARAVEGLGYATHGWRLARAETAAQGAA